jgi:hypothetical protein
MTPSRGEWLLAAACLTGGLALFGSALLFRNSLTPTWLVTVTASGGILSVVGAKLLLQAVILRYGQAQVPAWLVVLIVLALLSVLPIAALLNP